MVARDPSEALAPVGVDRGRAMLALVVSLFFFWGFTTVLVDSLIPKLKALFELTYTEVMLTQFSFFIAYFVCSVPAGQLVSRVGYVRGIVIGLVVMATGALLFVPAASAGAYIGFLVALFVLASGITVLQVAANPLIVVLGDARSSHSRLTLAQAFNSLGTTVGPWVGAVVILGGMVALPDPASVTPEQLAAARQAEAAALQMPAVAIAALLLVVAAIFWTRRQWSLAPTAASATVSTPGLGFLAGHPRLAFGVVSIFMYVGAEVSIGSVLVNYLMEPSTLALAAEQAGKAASLYWAGAMVGRFIGSAVLSRVSPGLVLGACAIAAALLAAASSVSIGAVAAVTVVLIGLFNSIMFPTIFSLALEGLGTDTPRGSGLLCLAIVGGAIVPLVTGAVADASTLHAALLVPAACYLVIAAYGWYARRPGA